MPRRCASTSTVRSRRSSSAGRWLQWSAAPDRASIRSMDATVALPVEISDWKPAPFALGGETVFAIGDVHGCASELRVLLDTIARLAADAAGKRRLIYLGDM